MNELQPTATRAPSGAVCSAHAERGARFICGRCGDYVCDDCLPSVGALVCVRCAPNRPRGLPFHRDNWTFAGIFRYAWAVLSADRLAIIGVSWAGLVPYYLIVAGPTLAFQFLHPTLAASLQGRIGQQLMTFATMSAAGPLALGLDAYWIARLRGESAGLGLVVSQLHRARAYVVLALLQVALCAPFTVLVASRATPGKLDASMFANSLYAMSVQLIVQFGAVELVVGESRGGLRALQVALGHIRRRPFAILGVAYAGMALMFLSMMCCALPFIVVAPYTGLTYVAVYLAARTPAPAA